MKEYTLSNGLKIVLCPMSNVHSVSVSLYVRSGSRNESNNEFGITHMLEHMHFRELKNLEQREIYYLMESIGSTLSGSTYSDFLRFHMKVHPMHLEKCIQLFAYILDTKCWSMDSIEKEKAVVLNEIYEKDSYTSADDCITQKVFGIENRIIGYENNVCLFNNEMLGSYKQKIFNNNNMLFCVFGNIKSSAIELVQLYFSSIDIPFGEKGGSFIGCDRRFLRSPDITLIKEDWECLDVNLSFDIDYTSSSLGELKLLNCILGEGVGSRLQLKIREELGYNYDIGSCLECYDDCAALHIRFSINKKLLLDCLFAIIEVIKDVKEKITQRDLDVSLPFFKENNQFYFDDPEDYSWHYAYNNFVLEKNDSILHMNRDEISQNRLRCVANNIFNSRNASLIIIGNSSGISKKELSTLIKSVD